MPAISGLRFGFQKSLSWFFHFCEASRFVFCLLWWIFALFNMLSNFCLRVLLLILWQGRFLWSTKFRQFFRSTTNCLRQVGLKLIFITIYGLRCFCEEAQKFKESSVARFCGTTTWVIFFWKKHDLFIVFSWDQYIRWRVFLHYFASLPMQFHFFSNDLYLCNVFFLELSAFGCLLGRLLDPLSSIGHFTFAEQNQLNMASLCLE